MELVNTDYNPCPEGAVSGFVKTSDGMDIRYAHWKSSNYPVHGTVLLLHGRAEYIEKLYEIVGDLTSKGFEVLTFDWRGQGGSSRLLTNPRPGYIDEFEHYLMDLEAVMSNIALPDCKAPFYILGHSTGSLIALLAAPVFSNRIRRMVLASPLLGFGRSTMSTGTIKFVSGLLCAVGLGQVYMIGGASPDEDRPFNGNRLTSDTRRFERNKRFVEENKDLSIGGPTAAWVFAASRAMDHVHDPDFHNQINIPTLLISAGNDEVISLEAIEEMGRRLRSGSSLTIPGARHELMHERDVFREQLLAAFYSFVPGTEVVSE